MTGFSVDTSKMPELSGQLGRVHGSLTKGRSYVEKYANAIAGQGLMMRVLGPHKKAFTNMTGALSGFARLVNGTATGVDKCRQHYETVEQQNSADANAVLRAEDEKIHDSANAKDLNALAGDRTKPLPPGLAKYATQTAFIDAADPGSMYTRPDLADPSTKWSYNIWTDGFSPTALVRWFVQSNFHQDIFNTAGEFLIGDWVAYEEAGVVWGRLGVAYQDMAKNLRRGAADTPTIWRGNAAENCQEYLVNVAAIMDEMTGICGKYSKSYAAAAKLATDARTALNDVLEQIIDKVIYALGLTALGDLLAETVVGAAVCWGRALAYVGEIGELIAKVVIAMNTFTAAVDKIAVAIDKLEMPGLPPMPAGLPAK